MYLHPLYKIVASLLGIAAAIAAALIFNAFMHDPSVSSALFLVVYIAVYFAFETLFYAISNRQNQKAANKNSHVA